jgi:hypothetical protein
MAEATSLKDRQRLDELEKKLVSLIKKLPTTLPCGSKDGPIATNFSDLTHDNTEGDGNYGMASLSEISGGHMMSRE